MVFLCLLEDSISTSDRFSKAMSFLSNTSTSCYLLIINSFQISLLGQVLTLPGILLDSMHNFLR